MTSGTKKRDDEFKERCPHCGDKALCCVPVSFYKVGCDTLNCKGRWTEVQGSVDRDEAIKNWNQYAKTTRTHRYEELPAHD